MSMHAEAARLTSAHALLGRGAMIRSRLRGSGLLLTAIPTSRDVQYLPVVMCIAPTLMYVTPTSSMPVSPTLRLLVMPVSKYWERQ